MNIIGFQQGGDEYRIYQEEVYRIMNKWYTELFNIKIDTSGYARDHIVPVSFGFFFDISPYRMNHYKNIQLLPIVENMKKKSSVKKEHAQYFLKETQDWKQFKDAMESGDVEDYIDGICNIATAVKKNVVKLKKPKKSKEAIVYDLNKKLEYYRKFMLEHVKYGDRKIYGVEISRYCKEHATIPFGGEGFKMELYCDDVQTETDERGYEKKYIVGEWK